MKNQAGHTIRARSERLVERRVGDEIVVYDLDTDKAHLLNPVTATVWSAASGGATIDVVCAAVRAEHGADLPLDVCWAAVEQLTEAGLLASAPGAPEAPQPGEVASGLSRRQLLKRAGVAAILLPTITTILAPTPAAAQTGTCAADGQSCNTNNECCSGNCAGGTCACQVTGGACAISADCCSTICQASVCCNGTGTACTSNAQCCTGICSNSTCVTCIANGDPSPSASACCSGRRGSNGKCVG